ncbi:hypothetical protein QSJ19_03015 [Gordonia sp. ABSL11-1]|uniref:hypothetical protein n=1 Tax=Gordonia sp. ABSL11-1 TaxID=3053924 RepID=UPI002573BDD4|nr:hypothetical protein [Gordonia sp. ABSL11-1]MDL9944570.1 hypothetical protein [Gordonia sp. ABSL11-1]
MNITRRFGDSMRLSKQLIEAAERSHGVRVSFASTQYSDGEQREAAECDRVGDHPFVHGYGALNHSGYHAVDTAVWLAGLDTYPFGLGSVEVQTTSRSVDDYLGRRGQSDPHLMNVGAEYDCVVNAKVRRHDGHSTLVSVASIHDSTSNRRWSRAQSVDEKLHLGRLSNELTLINQGELQNVLLRLLEVPHSAATDRLAGLPRRCMQADVTRNPLFAAELGRPVYEDLSPPPTQRSLSTSSKLRALQSFISKVRGDQYDQNIDLDRHFLSQLILLMAAQSVAGGGVRVVESADSWARD